MKETIVYLPMPHTVKEGSAPVFMDLEVYSALESAGVKWVQETPEEHKIRMLEDKVNDLKELCAELMEENYRLKTDKREGVLPK